MRGECPNPRPDCRYAQEGCFSDTHHIFYPRRDYRTPVEKAFRLLPENKVELCRVEHEEIHAALAPEKPPREVMLGAIAVHRANHLTD